MSWKFVLLPLGCQPSFLHPQGFRPLIKPSVQYYSRLAPFRGLFATGRPILTYHHVGPRARGARLKGLYVSPKLFAAQMRELADAGFSTRSLSDFSMEFTSATAPRPRVCVWLTFDDGFQDVFDHALPVLSRHGFRAVLFLVSDLLGKTNEWQQKAGDITEPLMDEAQVCDWLAAGQEIGSHTRTHPHLTQLPLAEARGELTASKKALEDKFGLAIEHFCYPYGDWNAQVRDLVREAGYKTACTTEYGVNSVATPRLELKRITARYPSRNLKAIWKRLVGRG
ncbi:MAG: polysaccharide deacetylase [Verrucomicrobia bacterium]|nr:MAG: polysaccharide deacetylase [Verrucomicrobiota bacterium]